MRWAFWVAFEWTLISLALVVASYWPLLWPLAVLFLGTRQHALAVLGHEAVHYGVHTDRKVNDRLGNLLCMWPLLTDVAGFREFHIRHHQFVGTDLDPERAVREPFAERWADLTPGKKMRQLARDLVGGSLSEAFYILRETRGRLTWRRGMYVVGLFSLAAFGLGWHVLLAWLVAMVTSNFAVMRLRMYREHLGPEVTQVYVAKWWERALYLPHCIWKHEPHHRPGRWSTPAWDL